MGASDRRTGGLLGAQVLAAEAGEVIQPAAMAIRAGMTISQLQEMMFPYLPVAEGLKLAALSFNKDPAMLSCWAG